MNLDFTKRHNLLVWQLLFIALGTFWLWAPNFNSTLSHHISLISQYESSAQPFSWLFRTTDLMAGALLLGMSLTFIRQPHRKLVGWLLFALSLGLMADPLLSTTCSQIGNVCKEYVSPSLVLHAFETLITATTLLTLSIYDSLSRKKLVSILFVIFQALYGLLFVSQLADKQRFNTVSQFVYEATLIIWLAWLCRDILAEHSYSISKIEARIVKLLAAIWAFINGILAIVISLSHIHLLGRIRAFYFAGDSAWLAQHGVIVGVIMLYLSRHLARGELRARQIFMIIVGIEALKYAVISPNPLLLILYSVTFAGLFILRDDFDRGVIPLTWQVRLRDLYFMVCGLLLALIITLLQLDRDNRVSIITSRAINHFSDYVFRSNFISRTHVKSALLAHTFTAFVVAAVGAILWILFKPYKASAGGSQDKKMVNDYLNRYSTFSEDFFKLWPEDKNYFWPADTAGFIAYKTVGPIAFALADPICPNEEDKKILVEKFMTWCKARRLKVCFLPIYENSQSIYKESSLELIQIGSSAVINIEKFITSTVKGKWWRWQNNSAKKAGYVYEQSLPPHNGAFLQQLNAVSNAWLTKNGHTERGFALGYFDYKYLQKCVIHYIKDSNEQVIAFVNQLPQFNQSLTVTIDLIRYLPEANHAMPFLISQTLDKLHAQSSKFRYFDLGFVPFAKAKGPALTIARTLSSNRFSAKGLEQFKNKFDPDWQPNYMAYQGDLADLALIGLNLEKAMEQKTD